MPAAVVQDPARERALIVSSDGHAVAPMREYRQYLPSSSHEEFDAFCTEYEKVGIYTWQPESLMQRTDADVVEQWVHSVIEQGRQEGQGNATRRLEELDREGISAEVLYPDFGMPFELHPPLVAAIRGYQRSPQQIELANKAHNRWLADFCATDSARFGGLAVLSFADVNDTLAEIRWAKDAGLRGIVLPAFDDDLPVFHPQFTPIWSLLEEIGLPVNTHTAISSVTNRIVTGTLKAIPHPACAAPLMTAPTFFNCQQLLGHFIWSGTLERHPNLQLVLTEQGSGWVVGALQGMDYAYEHSYLRQDIREVVPRKPSEYFARQVTMGASLLSRAEAEARHDIGIDKLAIGVDYPHHEGMWGTGPGTASYLAATLGAAGVSPEETEKMVGGNAIRVFSFDQAALRPVADRVGPTLDAILTPPSDDFYARGDVHKPLGTAW